MNPAELEGLIQLGLLAAQGIQALVKLCQDSTSMTMEQKSQLLAAIKGHLTDTNAKVQSVRWVDDPLFKGTQGP